MIECNGPLPGKEWLKFPEKIAAVSERLMGVQIECQPAVKLIKRYSRQNVLIYADPPYMHSTRTTTSYRYEMSDDDHEELLQTLKQHPGPVILSGYDNQMYDEMLQDWTKQMKRAKAEGGAIRKETLWTNPVAARTGFYQKSLF